MKIKQFSKITGLSPHTLRYYEKLGLLTVNRDSSGHRNYNDKDLEWAGFINRLRETGMQLKLIKQYADLRSQGNQTLVERRHILSKHAHDLKYIIKKEQQHLKALQKKIDWYNRQI